MGRIIPPPKVLEGSRELGDTTQVYKPSVTLDQGHLPHVDNHGCVLKLRLRALDQAIWTHSPSEAPMAPALSESMLLAGRNVPLSGLSSAGKGVRRASSPPGIA